MNKTKKAAIIVAIVLTIILFVGLNIAGATALIDGETPVSVIYWLSAIGYAAGGCKLANSMEAENE